MSFVIQDETNMIPATIITRRISEDGRDVTQFPEMWKDNDTRIKFKGHLHKVVEINRDAEIDLIYDLFDDMMLAGKMDAVDMLLRHWRLDDDIDSILAILTITLPAKTKLPSRTALLELAIERFGEERFGEEICGGL